MNTFGGSVQGTYWQDGQGGCAVGCVLHDLAPGREGEHALWEELLGIPTWVAQEADAVHESLPAELAVDWPARLIAAIPEGVDLCGRSGELRAAYDEATTAAWAAYDEARADALVTAVSGLSVPESDESTS